MDQDQFVFRSFSPSQDIPRLVSLYHLVETAEHIGMDTSEQNLRQQLEVPGHDPLKDRWIVEAPDDPGYLVASALVRVSPGTNLAEADIIVHPEWRRRGLGSQLLARIIERARELKAGVLQIFASTKHPGVISFLEGHGFARQGAYTELRLVQGRRLPPVIWPFGYNMRPYSEVQELATLTQAMNLCYVPLWGHQTVSEQEMAAWLSDFNAEGLFLVFSEKGRVVGISRVEPSSQRTLRNGIPTGYIDAPGIVPQHRRLDLYRALVLTGIRWLQEQGQSVIEMESWGDKLEVLKMYRELGFSDLRQLACYHLKLPAGNGKLLPLSP